LKEEKKGRALHGQGVPRRRVVFVFEIARQGKGGERESCGGGGIWSRGSIGGWEEISGEYIMKGTSILKGPIRPGRRCLS